MTVKSHFRPASRAVALEPRILFDGAAAVAGADALGDDQPQQDDPHQPASDNGPENQPVSPLAAPFGAPGADALTIALPDSGNVLIGQQFDFQIAFKNTGADTGYGPYIDLYLPNGADGDDGVTIAANGAITYLGQAVNYQIITLNAEGKADHPYARTSTGAAFELSGQANQKVVVIELPFGSYTNQQPAAELTVRATLHNYADLGAPLDITAVSGFRYGKTAVEDYSSDPSYTLDSPTTVQITPVLVNYDHVFNGPEHETATGPNFPRSITTTIDVADGQTLHDYVLTLGVPSNAIVTGVTGGTAVDGDILKRHFDTLTGSTTVTLTYYIPETLSGQGGTPTVLDPVTGAPSEASFHVSGQGQWTPLDARDRAPVNPGNPTGAIAVTYDPSGFEVIHDIKSLAIQKTVAITTDTGKPGASPNDTLTYTLDFQVSDYFSFKDLVIHDNVDDGHTLSGATPVFTLWHQGVEYSISLAGFVTDATDTTTHDISRTFNLSAAIRAALASNTALPASLRDGILTGGKFDGADEGGTYGRITYQATIDNMFESVTSGDRQINHGDHLRSQNVTISGTVVQANGTDGNVVNDATATDIEIQSGGLDLSISKVNGDTVTEADLKNGGVKPGDLVTYELTYDLSTGDFENLILDAYLPKPVFDAGGTTWTNVTSSDGTSNLTEGQWRLLTSGVTDVTINGSTLTANDNHLKFSLGNREDNNNLPTKVVIQFTVRVQDDPFTDGLYLTAQAQASDDNTPGETSVHQDIVQVRLNEPVLNIKHGIVASENGNAVNANWNGIETTTGKPFTSTITNINAVDFNRGGLDAGDTVRFATAISNTGGSGAFDLTTTVITPPPEFKLVGNSLETANLRVYLGNGTELVKGTDYTVSGGVITLLDADGNATLAQGRNGNTDVSDGSNILIITYDATANAGVDAGVVYTSTVGVESYAGQDGGKDFLPNAAKIEDSATATISAPSLKIVFQDGSVDNNDSSASHTTDANVVIGESMTYDIVVRLPEGDTHDLNVKALIPDGMQLDTTFNGVGYEIITTAGAGGSGALTYDFSGGPLTLESVSQNTGLPGAAPVFSFGTVTTTDNNSTSDNAFVIRVKLITANVAGNQAGTPLTPDASLTYDKGAENTNTLVNATEKNTTVMVVEPGLTINKTADKTEVDAGDVVSYTITITNNSGTDAFDLRFQDIFDDALAQADLAAFQAKQGTTGFDFDSAGTDITDRFNLVVRTLTLDGSAAKNVDLQNGQSIVIKVSAKTEGTVAAKSSFDSQAEVRWSSLDSTTNDEAGAPRDPNERDGKDGKPATGILNDYRASDGAPVNVISKNEMSRVGGMQDTAVPGNDTEAAATQAVGEIVRFRMVIRVPEGTIPDFQVLPQLPAGYAYLGNASIALVAGSMTASDLSSLISTSGNSALYGNIEAGLNAGNDGTRAAGSYPAGTIVAEMVDGKPVFKLGTLTNNDDDPDAEYVVIEFNAQVSNIAANQAGSELKSSFIVQSGTTQLGSVSNEVVDTIVEPSISAINKQVIATPDANLQGATDTLIVRNTFTSGSGANAAPAYDAVLTDSIVNGTSYTFRSLTVDGTTYGTLAEAQTAGYGFVGSDATGVTLSFNGNAIQPGKTISFEYEVTVPTGTAGAATAATLVWSSLPDAGPSAFPDFAGSTLDADGSAGGERHWDSATSSLNDYRSQGSAGYGTISGTIWDDTRTQNGTINTGETLLAGVTVTLTSKGPDGIWGTSDDVIVATTQTAADGTYTFGALPAGDYRVTVPASFTATISGDTDALTPRVDTDTSTLVGTIGITLGDGLANNGNNVGYLQVNDAPSFTGVGGSVSYTEGQNTATDNNVIGTPVRLTGPVTINDPELVDQQLDNFAGTTLTVARTNVANTGFAANTADILGIATASIGGLNVTTTATQVLVNGTVIGTYTSSNGELVVTFNAAATSATVNAVASAITYANQSHKPDASVTIRYRFNDANDSNKQGSGPALTGDATVRVDITPVNDPPEATNDTNNLLRNQETATGNILTGTHVNGSNVSHTHTADSDPDTDASALRVSNIQVVTPSHGVTEANKTVNSTGDTVIQGKYGSLTLRADGSYTYTLDRTNPAVYGLRDTDPSLLETFTYTLSDGSDGSDTANLAITINGLPVPVPTITPEDGNGAAAGHITVHESGLSNGTDASANTEIATGTITLNTDAGLKSVNIGGVTFSLATLKTASSTNPLQVGLTESAIFGKLEITGITITAGSESAPQTATLNYRYTLTTPPSEAGTDKQVPINLTVTDVHDRTSVNNPLTIRIVDDAPTAVNDVNQVGEDDKTPVTGNLIQGATDNAGKDTVGADGATVTGLTQGTVAAGSHVPNGGVESPVDGAYGKITVNADGSYSYVLDTTLPAVQALIQGETLTETFTYTITDADGDQSTATLTITINGANDDVIVTVPENHPDTPTAGDITDHVVFERGLTGGSAPNDNDLLVDSSFTILAPDGLDSHIALRIGLTKPDGTYTYYQLTRDQVEDLNATERSVYTQYGTLSFNGYSVATTGADKGTITVNYTYTLTSAPEVPGTDTSETFLITAFSKSLDTSATQTLNIKIVDDAPTARDDARTIQEDDTAALTGNVTGQTGVATGDVADTLGADAAKVTGLVAGTVSSGHVTDGNIDTTLNGSFGTITLNQDGAYSYVLDNSNLAVQRLNGSETLTEIFTYTITDKDGDQSTATLTITVTANNDGVTVTVPDNRSQITPDGNITDHVVFESALTNGSSPSANDTKVDASFTVLALDELHGTEAITLFYLDANGNAQTRILTLAEINDLGTTPVTLLTQYGTLVLDGVAKVADGTITIDYTYDLTKAPETDAVDVTTSFTVTAKDRDGDSYAQTLNIKIVDDAPTAVNDANALTRGLPDGTGTRNTVSGNVYTNDTIGADGAATAGPVTAQSNAAGQYGTLTLNADGSYSYALDASNTTVAALNGNQSLTDTFTYTITDKDGDTSTATLTITITGNTPPVANDDVRTVPEDTVVTGNVIQNGGSGDQNDGDADGHPLKVTQFTVDTDGDGTPETFTVSPGAPGTAVIVGKGTITVNEDGSYTFTPIPDWNGQVPDITYTVFDGLDRSDDAVLKITVTPVVDIENDTATTITGYPVTTPVLGNDSFEGSTPVVSVEPGNEPANGTVTVNPDGTITYMPNTGFVGIDTYTYTVTSGGVTETATVTVTVNNNPGTPVPDAITVPEDTPATGNLLTNDGSPVNGGIVDGDGHPLKVTEFSVDTDGDGTPETFTVSPGTPGTAVIIGKGTITIHEDGSYTFTPIPDWNGQVPQIVYTISDGMPNGDAKSTLDITVTPVADITEDRRETESSTSVTLDPLENDTFDNPDRIVTGVTQPGNGNVTLNPNGNITYTPSPGFFGDDTFTYTVTSGGVTETVTITINVKPENPPATPSQPIVDSNSPGTPSALVQRLLPQYSNQVGEPSVFYEGAVFDKVLRMPIPFHPIVYVNREVQVAQDERSAGDMRFFSNPQWVTPGDIQSTSIGSDLGMDPNLFVQHAVRQAQRQGDLIDHIVNGRPGRTSLSSDQQLPTPEPFQPRPELLVPGEASQRNAAPQDGTRTAPPPAEAPAAPEASAAAADGMLPSDAEALAAADDASADSQLLAHGSPSFSEQLRGGSARLPAPLHAPNKSV